MSAEVLAPLRGNGPSYCLKDRGARADDGPPEVKCPRAGDRVGPGRHKRLHQGGCIDPVLETNLGDVRGASCPLGGAATHGCEGRPRNASGVLASSGVLPALAVLLRRRLRRWAQCQRRHQHEEARARWLSPRCRRPRSPVQNGGLPAAGRRVGRRWQVCGGDPQPHRVAPRRVVGYGGTWPSPEPYRRACCAPRGASRGGRMASVWRRDHVDERVGGAALLRGRRMASVAGIHVSVWRGLAPRRRPAWRVWESAPHRIKSRCRRREEVGAGVLREAKHERRGVEPGVRPGVRVGAGAVAGVLLARASVLAWSRRRRMSWRGVGDVAGYMARYVAPEQCR